MPATTKKLVRSPTLVRQHSARRVLWLVGTLTATLLAAETITIALLLGVVEDESRERLRTTSRNLGDLVEAVARFDALHSQNDHPEGATGATLSQIAEALRTNDGESVEILLGKKDGTGVVIVLPKKFTSKEPLLATSMAATPFLAALAGQSGDLRVIDPAGRDAWCAYRPLPTLQLALVVEQTVVDMRAPVLHAGGIAALVSVLLGAAGIAMLLRQANPLLDELTAQAEASRAKSSFLSNMSHEIRTPLNAIVGLLHLLRGSTLGDKSQGYVRQMNSSAVTLQRLINDVLDLSKIEAGMMTLEKVPFRLDALLETVANQLAVHVGEKPVELMISVDPTLPVELRGDALRLQQVLLNLVANALKFTERGSVVVEVKLAGLVGHDAALRFAVRDTGIGIAPADLVHLFEKFTQVDTSTSRRFGGTGLGLAISKELVELMGGELLVESELGKGTAFSFLLRMQAAEGTLAKRFTLPVALAGLHVLVIDDMALSRDLLRSLLQAFGCRVTCAANGQEGLARWKESKADPIRLALVDWRMPDIDGLEVIRRLRAGQDGVTSPKAVLITGANRAALRDEDLHGLDGFLTKPVDPSSLYNAIIAAITVPTSATTPVISLTADSNLGKGYRLLVAEDHVINQTIIRELLEDAGYHIDVAGDGSSAVAAAQTTTYDAVLMDIHMPIMDGVEATRHLRADPRTKQLPIIALTADVMVESAEVFRAAGMDDVVAKPINVEQLLATLQRHLRGRKRSDLSTLWDRDGGIRRTGGNVALYERMLTLFIKQETDLVVRIRAALEAKDQSRADGLAHALKGVAGNLGLGRVAEAASTLHDHWYLGHAGDTEVLLQALEQALHEAFAVLSSAAASSGELS